MINLKHYNELMTLLKRDDMDYSLDPNRNAKIDEILKYVLKYESLPTRKATFKCEEKSIIEWIEEIKESNDEVSITLIKFISQFKPNFYGLKIWNFKYKDLYSFILENKRLPYAYEEMFFDGTDMRKWFNTQMDCYREKRNYKLQKEQTDKLENLLDLLKNVSNPKEELPNKQKIKEWYQFLLREKRIPILNKDTFSDQSNIITFINEIVNQKIVLTNEEQELFNKVQFLMIRINKDGIQGYAMHSKKKIDYKKERNAPRIKKIRKNTALKSEKKIMLLNKISMGSYLTYFRNRLGLNATEMANLLKMHKFSYIHVENNDHAFSYFRRILFKVLLNNLEFKDEVLLKMEEEIEKSLECKSKLDYALNALCAYFYIADEVSERQETFTKKYRTKFNSPKETHYSPKSLITLYKELEDLEKESSLSIQEQIKKVKECLKSKVFSINAEEQIINITNIVLGLSYMDVNSIYKIGTQKAEELVRYYENYKQTNKLNNAEIVMLNRCIQILNYELHLGENLDYEINRFSKMINKTKREIAKKIGCERTLLSHAQEKLSENIKEDLFTWINTLEEKNNPAIVRFNSVLLNAQILKRQK